MKSKNIESLYIGKNGCCVDHLGNYYVSIWSMCSAWGTYVDTFLRRISRSKSVKYALTHNNSTESPVKDTGIIWVFGEPFPSYIAIDKAYGYSTSTACRHKDNLEEWLLSNQRFFVDDRLFGTYMELSMEYDISEQTIKERLRSGWSLYDAVHRPIDGRGKPGIICVDHLGNEYSSITDMLLHYKISSSCYYKRLAKGYSLEKILTTPMKVYMTNKPKKDARVSVVQ